MNFVYLNQEIQDSKSASSASSATTHVTLDTDHHFLCHLEWLVHSLHFAKVESKSPYFSGTSLVGVLSTVSTSANQRAQQRFSVSMVHPRFFPTLITNYVSSIWGYRLPREYVLPIQNTLVFPRFTFIGNLEPVVSRHVSGEFWSPPPTQASQFPMTK